MSALKWIGGKGRSSLVIAAALTAMAVGAVVAHGDNLQSDLNTTTGGLDKTVDLGTLPANTSQSQDVSLYVDPQPSAVNDPTYPFHVSGSKDATSTFTGSTSFDGVTISGAGTANAQTGQITWTTPAAQATAQNYTIVENFSADTTINTSPATVTIKFSVAAAPSDTTPPYVSSVSRSGLTPTNASSVSWAVQLSESVSGVGTADFGLSTSGVSGASITSVSPAGPASSYTVTASTGTGDGTIGLNLVDDDSIKDGANNPLGTSSGPGDGGFTNQAPYTIDKSAPIIELTTDDTAAATGWFNIASDTGNDGIKLTASASDVSGVASLTCTDNSSAFISLTSSPFSDTKTLSDGTHNVSCTASDTLGNTTASGSKKTGVYKVDLTAPSVSISSPGDGTTTIAPSINVSGSASDATSGVGGVKVNGNAASGTTSWSYTLSLACGSNSITATATDVAGNSRSSSPAIGVNRLCFGLQYFQPLDQSTSTATMNVGKYGRVIPVKVSLSLLGGATLDQAALDAYGLTLQMGVNTADCSSGDATDALEAYADAGQSSTGTNLFRWDSIAAQWIYNLDTKAPPGVAMTINKCYRLDVYVSDGTNKVKVSTSTYALFKPVK
jgi:hypothetical protein